MVSVNGNSIPNQFIITDGNVEYFQSYKTIIVKVECSHGINQITLDPKWDCSKTTSKYRALFLDETTKETERKIKDGTYKVKNLNS
jgi:hypothetical protein